MAPYRCYFLDRDYRIAAAEIIDAGELPEAIERAAALLRDRPRHHSIELWRGATLVYRPEEVRFSRLC
jgi:hypothetical protein